MSDVSHFFHQLALAGWSTKQVASTKTKSGSPIDAISRQIGANVGIGAFFARYNRTGPPWLQHVEHRAGFRIPLAEQEEVKGVLLGQDSQVGLGVPRGQSRCAPGEITTSNALSG